MIKKICTNGLFAIVLAGPLWSSTSFAEDQSAIEKIPAENVIIQVPGLPVLGAHRLTWGFLRPPFLWIQDRIVNLQEIDWPAWDFQQIPVGLNPSRKGKSEILIYDEQRKLIDTIAFKKTFQLERYQNPNKSKPFQYQLQVTTADDRVVLRSSLLTWIQRKEVFTCQNTVADLPPGKQLSVIKNCVETLRGLMATTDQQWYFNVTWPRVKDKIEHRKIGDYEREFKKITKKANNLYDSSRKQTPAFLVSAGVTNIEKIQAANLDAQRWPRANIAVLPPSRDVIQSRAALVEVEGYQLEIRSFAADQISTRQSNSPSGLVPAIDVQFIAAQGEQQLKVVETEFKQHRTGVSGFLRPWQFATFLEYNALNSNRGEQDSFFGLPGFEINYVSPYFKLQPSLRISSGLWHPGSSLSVQEFQVTVKRDIEIIPRLQAVLGYHRYSLNGKNPGSSRLGKMDAGVLGLSGSRSIDNALIQGKVLFFLGESTGYDTQVSYGRFFQNSTDLRFYWGPFVGSSRYASTLINRTLQTETFTEDILRVGLQFGLVGPDLFAE